MFTYIMTHSDSCVAFPVRCAAAAADASREFRYDSGALKLSCAALTSPPDCFDTGFGD